MGRYKERETTSLSDSFPLPPPSLYSFENEDTKTGRIGKGWGETKQEARDNAWKDLKYGREPRYREKLTEAPKTPSSGVDDGGDPILALAVVFILGLTFICMFIIGLCSVGDHLSNGIEMGIQRIFPRFETRQDQAKQLESEWQETKDFFTGSERQLIVTENKPVLPQARLVFLAEGKDKKKRVMRINLDGTGRAVATNISVNQYNDMYDMKWMPTGKTSGNSMRRTHHYRSSSVPSSNEKKLAYFEGETVSFHWGASLDGTGQVVLKDLVTKTEKKISGASFKSMGTMTPQAWSPDENKLALGVPARGGYQVIQIIDQGRRGKPYILSAFGRNPSWSPDGNWIAFDHKGEIFIFEIGTVNPKTIKSRPQGDGPFTGGETFPIARGNIIRIGAGEKPFWEKETQSFKSESQATSKLRSPSVQDTNITTQSGQRAPVVDISSTPPSQRPAMYVPAMRMPNENCVGLYLCTEDNYNLKEWRVTPKTVSSTFDGGKTWHILYDLRDAKSGLTIHNMEAIDNRVGTERSLLPNKRDIFLIIEKS